MRKHYFVQIQCDVSWAPFNHEFTHFRLHVTPQPVRVLKLENGFADQTEFEFFTLDEIIRKGVPAPVFNLLCRIRETQGELQTWYSRTLTLMYLIEAQTVQFSFNPIIS